MGMDQKSHSEGKKEDENGFAAAPPPLSLKPRGKNWGQKEKPKDQEGKEKLREREWGNFLFEKGLFRLLPFPIKLTIPPLGNLPIFG